MAHHYARLTVHGWQGATTLWLDDRRQYVRDPDGVVAKQWLASTYTGGRPCPVTRRTPGTSTTASSSG